MIPISAVPAARSAAHCEGSGIGDIESRAGVSMLEIPHQRRSIKVGNGGNAKAFHAADGEYGPSQTLTESSIYVQSYQRGVSADLDMVFAGCNSPRVRRQWKSVRVCAGKTCLKLWL